jgi:hypothetical protein
MSDSNQGAATIHDSGQGAALAAQTDGTHQASVEQRLDELQSSIEKLQRSVDGLGAVSPTTNGRSSPGTSAAVGQASAAPGAAGNLFSWPSKGVDYYSIAYTPAFTAIVEDVPAVSVNFTGPDGTVPTPANYTKAPGIEIEWTPSTWTERFSWEATYPNPMELDVSVARSYADINGLSGEASGPMTDLLNTPSLVTPMHTVSYGFYDAGSEYSMFTNRDQVYVYATPNMQDWMAHVSQYIKSLNSSAVIPVGAFVLPGAHDSGMYDRSTIDVLAGSAAAVGGLIDLFITGGLLPTGTAVMLADAAIEMMIRTSFTQKEDITAQLNLGVRFFDVRPATCAPVFEQSMGASGLYHQHNFVPGCHYDDFLRQILTWLGQHPGEIVIVWVNRQDIASSCGIPTDDDLETALTTALQTTNMTDLISPLTGGTLSAWDVPEAYYDNLLANKNRLVMFYVPQAGTLPQAINSSYGAAYATTVPQPIINALDAWSLFPQPPMFNLLQMQATTTAIDVPAPYLEALLSWSESSSPLMSTKAIMDAATLPWIVSNYAKFANQGLVILNDFVDNAMSAVASDLSVNRIKHFNNMD